MNPLKFPLLFALTIACLAAAPGPNRAIPATRPLPINSAAPRETKTIEEIDQSIADLQQHIELRLGRMGVTLESITTAYNDLQARKEQINLTLAGKKVKEHAIQQKIQELSKQAYDEIDNDKTLIALRKVAADKQSIVERAQQLSQNNLMSKSELELTIAQAAEAQVRIQERRDTIAANVGGGILPALNKELVVVSLDISEQEAVRNYVEERLSQVENARALYKDYERLMAERSRLLGGDRDARGNGFSGRNTGSQGGTAQRGTNGTPPAAAATSAPR